MQCPECGSKRVHLSRRKGLLEKGILASIFFRPFRCEKCDVRFFRLSFASHANHSRTAATN
jgi:DNA-directed RNA polymerase subunit RPC12/RpoP